MASVSKEKENNNEKRMAWMDKKSERMTHPAAAVDKQTIEMSTAHSASRGTAPDSSEKQINPMGEGLMLQQYSAAIFRSMQAVAPKEACKRAWYQHKRFWYTLISLLSLLGIIHLAILLYVALSEPTNVNIEYKWENWLKLPRVHFCDYGFRNFDSQKLSRWNISREHVFAHELGVGIVGVQAAELTYTDVDLDLLSFEYEELIRRHGSIYNAFVEFSRKFSRKCSDIIYNCQWKPFPPKDVPSDCCQLFEPVFTLSGLCFVSKPGAIPLQSVKSMGSLKIQLIFKSAENLQFFNRNYYLIEPSNAHFEIADELTQVDDTSWQARSKTFAGGKRITASLIQKKRQMIPDRNRCLRQPLKLTYFKEYSLPNCNMEKLHFSNLKLLTGSDCQLPLFKLLNPDFELDNPCPLDVMLKLLKLQPLKVTFVNTTGLSNESLQFLSKKCHTVTAEKRPAHLNEKRKKKPLCTLTFLEQLHRHNIEVVPAELLDQVYPMTDIGRVIAIAADINRRDAYTIRTALMERCNATNLTDLCAVAEVIHEVGAVLSKQIRYTVLKQIFIELLPTKNTIVTQLQNAYSDRQDVWPRMQDFTDQCLPLCTSTSHMVKYSEDFVEYRLIDSDAPGAASVVLFKFLSAEVERTLEVHRLHWAEYLVLIGGNLGMWNGASLLSVVNLGILLFGWMNIRS